MMTATLDSSAGTKPSDRLRILCGFSDLRQRTDQEPPEKALEGHDVTVVHSIDEIKGAIETGTFDFAFLDLALPKETIKSPKDPHNDYGTFILAPRLKTAGVKGVVLFSQNYSMVSKSSASIEQWTELNVTVLEVRPNQSNGPRDWRTMLASIQNYLASN